MQGWKCWSAFPALPLPQHRGEHGFSWGSCAGVNAGARRAKLRARSASGSAGSCSLPGFPWNDGKGREPCEAPAAAAPASHPVGFGSTRAGRAGGSPGAPGFVEAGRARRANTAPGNSRASSAGVFITMMFILFRARSLAARGGGDRVVESGFLLRARSSKAVLPSKWLLVLPALPSLRAGVTHPQIPPGSDPQAAGGVFSNAFTR